MKLLYENIVISLFLFHYFNEPIDKSLSLYYLKIAQAYMVSVVPLICFDFFAQLQKFRILFFLI